MYRNVYSNLVEFCALYKAIALNADLDFVISSAVIISIILYDKINNDERVF